MVLVSFLPPPVVLPRGTGNYRSALELLHQSACCKVRLPIFSCFAVTPIVVALVSHNWWPKASITQIWEPKRLQNGAQNGAGAKRADPHETCAGVSGSHVPPPLGAPFGRLLQRPEKGHPKVNIIPPLSKVWPKSAPRGLPKGDQNVT